MSLKSIRNFIIGLTLLVIGFGAGFKFASQDKIAPFSLNKTATFSTQKENLDFSLFWDVWDRLEKYYIDKKSLDPTKMYYGAIGGMVNALGDPYTVFLPPAQNKEAKDDLSGKFEGVGAQLGVKDKKIVVISPLKGTPAEKSGLLPGDWIVKVDGKETINWTLPEAVSKIRGPKGSTVVLTILHKDATKPIDISLVRETINVASVEWENLNVKCQSSNVKCELIKEECGDCERVVYLKLGRFGDQTTDEWNKAIGEIVKVLKSSNGQKYKGLIFDLRNNPGGYLSGSVFIASEFLKDGTIVVQEHSSGIKQTYSVNRKGQLTDVPLVILINQGTASASEIVAGALQTRGRAKIVGETSFGKGSVQEAQELPGGAGIHITTAKWLLPDGKWINGSGIDPDVKIENNPEKPDEDLQLVKAVEMLLGKIN